MKKLAGNIPLILAILISLACFCFFFFYYPYHLFYKEQISLFLLSDQTFFQYFPKAGWLSQLTGDFLTQYFYYIGAGPAIITALLLLLGILCYKCVEKLLQRFRWKKAVAFIIAALVCGLEFWLQCSSTYPLSSTISVLGVFLVVYIILNFRKLNIWTTLSGILQLGIGIWMFCPFSTFQGEKEGVNLRLEKFFALDTETNFGHWQKVEMLSEEDLGNYVNSYYHNLSLAMQGKLADGLLDYYQAGEKSLLLPVAQTETHFSIFAANEVWFQMGDMTMAEHAAILGMIFSPNHSSFRAIKRLAEINLIQGEEKAAAKYLHMLSKSSCYKTWAREHTSGKQTEKVKQFIDQKKSLLAKTDTLRLAGQNRMSLVNLLKSNPNNQLARDYLLCLDLLNKNLNLFAADYMEFANGIFKPIYAQALLIIQSVHPELLQGCKMPMQEKTLKDFQEYMNLYTQNQGRSSAVKNKFSRTYWYYYHYAKTEN